MTAVATSGVPMRGVFCLVGGLIVITLNDAIVKWLSGGYPLHEIVFVRAAIALTVTLGIARLEGGLALLKTRRPLLHLARGLLLVAANMCYFLALAAMALADAAAIFFVAPLLITGLSAPMLGERVGYRRWIAVAVGLVGVTVMLRPDLGFAEPAAFLPLGAALAYALMQMLTRRLGVTERGSALAFYVQLTFLASSALIGLAVGHGSFAGTGHPSLEFLLRAWTWPAAADGGLFLACGLLSAVGGYFIFQGYRLSEANLVAPFEYTALPMAVLWGFLIWGDLPDQVTILGIGLIVGSGLFVLYRETVRGRAVALRQPMPRNR